MGAASPDAWKADPPPSPENDRFDVLGFGVVAVDEVLDVDEFPPADAKTPVTRWIRRTSGLAGMALVAAARLGSRVGYAGRLGFDELSEVVLQDLQENDVDTRHVVRVEGARPYHSAVVVDGRRNTRNVFFQVGPAGSGADRLLPGDEVITATRAILVDQLGLPGMTRIARAARAAGIPVVGDVENPGVADLSELLAAIDHLLLSQATATSLTGESDPGSAAAALWDPARRCAAVTAGAAGVWFVSGEQPGLVQHQLAFPVIALDTTGCGDVFHGAYAHAIASGDPVAQAIRFASAAAALMATGSGPEHVPPTAAEVDALLRDTGARLHAAP